MSSLNLQSCRSKLTRAKEHLDFLNLSILAWMDLKPYSIERQRNSEHTRHSLVVRIREKPDLLRWSLVAADCVHNARTALDHLVYAVAAYEANSAPPPDGGKLAFPIEACPKGFEDRKWRIRSLSSQVIAAIESVQPYRRKTETEVPPLLSILRFLDDIDKHRLLHLAFFQQHGGQFGPLKVRAKETINAEVHLGEIVDGTEIVTVALPTPDPDYHLEFTAWLAITIPHEEGPPRTSRSDVISLLTALLEEVRQVSVIVRDAVPT